MDYSGACAYSQAPMDNEKPSQAQIVDLKLNRKPECDTACAPDPASLQADLDRRAPVLGAFVAQAAKDESLTFMAFEKALRVEVFSLARAAIVVFLALVEERVVGGLASRFERGGRLFRKAPKQDRGLQITLGVVRYWRTYAREVATKNRRGFHPLDVLLGLTADRFSMPILALAVRMATKMSFAEAHATLGWFVPTPPSTEVIERATLGFGRFTEEWFEHRPPPEGDGDVLIIMIDSKAVPTATAEELRRRRGRRKRRPTAGSARHRGRSKRKRRGKKRRRKKGDKSKNGKAATLVVMYTLRRQGRYLLGPINRQVYGSFAAKRQASGP